MHAKVANLVYATVHNYILSYSTLGLTCPNVECLLLRYPDVFEDAHLGFFESLIIFYVYQFDSITTLSQQLPCLLMISDRERELATEYAKLKRLLAE
jgi:hypothetical protein